MQPEDNQYVEELNSTEQLFERNMVLRIKSKIPTHQIGKLARLCWAIKTKPPNRSLHLIGDSKFVRQGLTTDLPKWAAKDFIKIVHEKLFKAAAAER